MEAITSELGPKPDVSDTTVAAPSRAPRALLAASK
jgi:hypothetical protein